MPAVAFIALAALFAAPPDSAAIDTAHPAFGDYPATGTFSGTPARVDFRGNAEAGRYRAALREGARKGPNFAGHFTIVIWGCGSACQQFAIVDAITGSVFFPKEVPYVSFADREEEPYGLQFRRGSRLLLIYGHVKEEDPGGVFPYVWEENRLRPLKYPPR